MGYGKNLEKAIKNKGMSVRHVAGLTGISADTLYSAIRRDSSVRFDHALSLSVVLPIRVTDICKDIPFARSELEKAVQVIEMYRCLEDNGSYTPFLLYVAFMKICEEKEHKEKLERRKKRRRY